MSQTDQPTPKPRATQKTFCKLYIYPNFSEVRQKVASDSTTLQVRLPQEAWRGIVNDSITLEGLSFAAMEQSLEDNWLYSLEGKKAYLQRRKGKPEKVRLVRASDLLVQDEAGHFFNVRYEDLRFTEQPPKNPTQPNNCLSFLLHQSGEGTLSYLTQNISWRPRYILQANGDSANLSALADIRNNSPLDYQATSCELYGGDVEVDSNDYDGLVVRSMSFISSADAPEIEEMGELQGLYRYRLSKSLSLTAHSTLSLPFVETKVSQFERYAQLRSHFSNTNYKGKLERAYRLVSEQALPAGKIFVREDGCFVGQETIPNTNGGGRIELSLGQDPDISYNRTVEIIGQQKNNAGELISTSYRVTFEVENAKDRNILTEIFEKSRYQDTIIENDQLKQSTIIELKLELAPHSITTASYEITLSTK